VGLIDGGVWSPAVTKQGKVVDAPWTWPIPFNRPLQQQRKPINITYVNEEKEEGNGWQSGVRLWGVVIRSKPAVTACR
jgi:hypothetical protein